VLRSATFRGRWDDGTPWQDTLITEMAGPISGHWILPGTLAVPAGTVLELDPDVSTHLEFTAGSLVNRGVLRGRPSSPDVQHRISFAGVDESAFVGGGMVPLPETDRGLWVIGDGKLDLAGSVRTPWRRAIRSLGIGAVAVELDGDVEGWQPGDELVITPTAPPSVAAHWTLSDHPRVKSVEGRVVHLDRPLLYGHPTHVCRDGRVFGAEVANLTRNVNVEGTPQGRAHVMIVPAVNPDGSHGHSTGRQTMSYVGFRFMGPRQGTGTYYTSGGKAVEITAGVKGRYGGPHWHHCGDGSKGSVLTGCVVRDSGNSAYWPHMSNGIRGVGLLADNVMEDAYGWDPRDPDGSPQDPSHGIEWIGCGASRITCTPPHGGKLLTGFVLGNGEGNRRVGCWSVGVQGSGTGNSSGAHWPEGATSVWEYGPDEWGVPNVEHNNRCHGINTWQNTNGDHVVDEPICYNNGRAGIAHGAYGTHYIYQGMPLRRGELSGNGLAPVELHAHSTEVKPQVFQDLVMDASGKPHAFRLVKHRAVAIWPNEIRRCLMVGHTVAALGFVYTGADGVSKPEWVDVYDDCEWDGLLLDEAQFALMLPGSRVRWMSATTGDVLQTWTV
jgi:hypothetical protein